MPLGETIKFSGKKVLMRRPAISEKVPNMMQRRFSLKLSSTVLRDFPPYLTMVNWITMVLTRMMRKSGLFKKFSKTLASLCLSFLALISLKICKRTKTLKKIE